MQETTRTDITRAVKVMSFPRGQHQAFGSVSCWWRKQLHDLQVNRNVSDLSHLSISGLRADLCQCACLQSHRNHDRPEWSDSQISPVPCAYPWCAQLPSQLPLSPCQGLHII